MNNTNVDSYLSDGCGRCDKFATPECKVHLWTEPLLALRKILLDSELTEEMKWGSPCYTLGGKNVVMMSSFKDFCSLSFFKGAAMTDEAGLLEQAGPNSHIARLLKFRALQEVQDKEESIAQFIQQAIELERAGVQVHTPNEPEAMPEELAQTLASDPDLERAFHALTPGRRRSHILHISGAKQSATRQKRVEKCLPKILLGKGFHDR